MPHGFLGFLLAGVSALEMACIETPQLPRLLPLGQQYTTRDLVDDKGCLIPKGTEIIVQGGLFDRDAENARSMKSDLYGRPERGAFNVFIIPDGKRNSRTCRNFAMFGPRDFTNFTTPAMHPRPSELKER
jgi:hypothetical protein